MKQTLTFLSIILLALSSTAQIEIRRSDLPCLNQRTDYSLDYQAKVPSNMADTGSNIVWDFSTAKEEMPVVKKILPASADQLSKNFPDCNMIREEDSAAGYRLFVNMTDTALYYLGDNEEDEFSSAFVNFRALKLPLKRNDNWQQQNSGTFQFSGQDMGIPADSVRIQVVVDYALVADAEGTIKLPVGQTQVLRLRTDVTAKIAIFAKLPLVGWQPLQNEEEKSITFTFMGKESGDKIAEMVISAETWGEEEEFTFRKYSLTSVKELAANATMNVYPNPSSVGSSVTLESTSNGELEVFDATMKKVGQTQSIAEGENIMLTEGLTSGIYFLHINTPMGKITRKLVIR
jgi:hypothetical protein